jgi:hypothetical protein
MFPLQGWQAGLLIWVIFFLTAAWFGGVVVWMRRQPPESGLAVFLAAYPEWAFALLLASPLLAVFFILSSVAAAAGRLLLPKGFPTDQA